MRLIGKALYPLFGIGVLLTYLHCLRAGIEPLEADSERHVITGVTGSYGGAHYRVPSVFRYGGLGGK